MGRERERERNWVMYEEREIGFWVWRKREIQRERNWVLSMERERERDDHGFRGDRENGGMREREREREREKGSWKKTKREKKRV